MNICICCPDGHPVTLAADKLGQVVACPRCFATFRAELEIGLPIGARKVSRSRDDDDDDDDEEEERPKKKPVAKKQIKSRARDDDDDDDEEDEEGDEEQEAEIEWTGRKRQLNTCGIGLMIMMVAYYVLIAMIVCLGPPMMWDLHLVGQKIQANENKLAEPTPGDWEILGLWIIAPGAGLSLTILVIGLFFNFFVPARAGARGMVLCALIFAGLVYLMGALILLKGAITDDAARQANMFKLFAVLAGLCFVVCFMSAMAYMAKLMIFMKMNLEASQPVTNTMFYLMYFGAMFGIYIANSYVSYYLFWFACYAMVAALFFAAAMAVRMGIAQAMVFMKVRGMILKYIRDD